MVSESKMREILFRGKRSKTGEWVEGLLFHHCEKSSSIWSEKLDKAVWVIPETVGQFTGLTDKNGKRIFEGDIVRYHGFSPVGVVRYGEFNCSCCDGVYGWYFDGEDIRVYNSYDVIGNIHDNPELLEVSHA